MQDMAITSVPNPPFCSLNNFTQYCAQELPEKTCHTSNTVQFIYFYAIQNLLIINYLYTKIKSEKPRYF